MISLPASTGIKCLAVFILQFFSSCDDGLNYDENGQVVTEAPLDTLQHISLTDSLSRPDTASYKLSYEPAVGRDTSRINTKTTTPSELVVFAETQLGVRYKYASIDPKVGFDCSGFITYVFNHFGIKVPRSSVDFTNVGKAVPVKEAKVGDLILFTGTNNNIRVVGHMGIVHSIDSSEIRFIHPSSGKANGVTITPLNGYYQGRFMSIRRVFPDK